MARPSKFDRTQNAILRALRQGATRTAAAEAAGVHRSTLCEWLKQPERAAFLVAVQAAEAGAELHYSDALFDSAKGGKLLEETTVERFNKDGDRIELRTTKKWSDGNPGSAEFWLERRRREEYRRRDDLNIGGQDGNPVRHRHAGELDGVPLSEMTTEELETYIREAERRNTEA